MFKYNTYIIRFIWLKSASPFLDLGIFQKQSFLFWCKDVEWNPIRNQNEFHDYHCVQKETEGIPTKLASFPKHDPQEDEQDFIDRYL